MHETHIRENKTSSRRIILLASLIKVLEETFVIIMLNFMQHDVPLRHIGTLRLRTAS